VHGDEAAIGNDARALLQGGWNQLFRLGWAELPQLGYASVAVVMRVFGDDLYGLRMSSVIAGVLSVFLLYLIVRRAFGRRPALLAAFVLAVAQWHIQFSRTGFHYIQALLATLTVFFFALRALDNRQELDFLFTGFSVGLCLIVYYAARVVPILLALYLLYRILRERGFLRANLLGFACLMLGACVFLAPQLASYEHSPGEWSSRSNAVWLFSPDVLAHERQVYGVQSEARIVAIQAERTIESINRIGETSVQYGRPGRPLFDFWSAALLVPGVLYAMSRARQSRYFLLTVWLWVPLVLGVMLTVDAPASPRMIVVLPVLAVFPALVVDAGWRATEQLSGRTGQVAFGALVVALGALILHANYHDYFQQQVTKLRVAGYFTLLSQYARHVNGRDRIYLVSADNSLGYDTVRFLVPHLDGEYLGPDPGLPLTGEPRGKGGAFVLSYSAPDWAKTLATLQRAYPGGVRESHTDAAGVLEFTSYEVGAAELSRTPG
jgi:4-amino-4-deoxy-L-arabinose transferase-like glycosyltransferase